MGSINWESGLDREQEGRWWTDAYRIFFSFSMNWGGWFHDGLKHQSGEAWAVTSTNWETLGLRVSPFLRFWILICKMIGFSQIIFRGASPYKIYNRKKRPLALELHGVLLEYTLLWICDLGKVLNLFKPLHSFMEHTVINSHVCSRSQAIAVIKTQPFPK